MVWHPFPLSATGHRQHGFQVLRCFRPHSKRADPQLERGGRLQDVRSMPARPGEPERYRLGPRGWRAQRKLPVLLATNHNAALSLLRASAAVVTSVHGRRFGVAGGEMELPAAADL